MESRQTEPLRPAGPYALFVRSKWNYMKNTGKLRWLRRKYGDTLLQRVSKDIANDWKKLSDREKKVFHDMAEMEKLSYKRQLANCERQKGVRFMLPESRTEKIRRIQNELLNEAEAPKRPVPSFQRFCSHVRSQQSCMKGVTQDTSPKALSNLWHQLSPEEKNQYREQTLRLNKQFRETKVKYIKRRQASL